MNPANDKRQNPQEESKGSEMPPSSQNMQFQEMTSEQSSKTIGSLYTPFQDVRHRGFTGFNMNKINIFNAQTSSEHRQVNNIESGSENVQPNLPTTSQVLWGTNININEITTKIRNFYVNFNGQQEYNRNSTNYYINQLMEIKDTEIFILNVDASHINSFDKGLYLQLINFPSEMIPIMDNVANSLFNELFTSRMENARPQSYIQVIINNLIKQSRIRDLGPDDIDKLISITGLTIRSSEIIPEMREAYFKCSVCDSVDKSVLYRSKINEPTECKNCHSKLSFELIHNRCLYNDKQHVKIQETPEHMPEGETPLTIHLCCYDRLVDFIKPGDRCEVVGIFRAQGLRINPRIRNTKSTYRTYIDVVSFTKYSKKRLISEDDDNNQDFKNISNELNEDYLEKLKNEINQLKKNPRIYEILVDSLAPSIWENEDVKKGLLLQLFGGVSKDFTKSGRGRFRGDINVLLVGDPSTAKSQLLQYVHNLAPRGIYTSGKGSSVVGLTAYVTKDPETKETVLESGALVLSDKGICCIDEFDKMDENTRVILHEAMEQQTISIAKAGIICTLNARSAILASANPINSKYEPKLSVVKNINIPPTLLSRFDLIYLMLDKHSDSYDRRLANHIVSLYGRFEEDEEISKEKIISKELLTAYISEARKLEPKIHEDIEETIIKYYIEMRGQSGSKNTISATPRQLESLIRLSEARARLRFSDYVQREDVEEAIRLIKVATQQAATDPVTGKIDMDMITTGLATSSRQKLNTMCESIKNLLRDFSDQMRKGVKLSNLSDELKKRADAMGPGERFTFTEYELRDALKIIEEENIISILGNKKSPIIRLLSNQYQ